MDFKDIIKKLNLSPLPLEGGYFRVTHLGENVKNRPMSSAIYYLITPESYSSLHRLRGVEIFHFYAGDAVEMLQISTRGKARRIVLGSDLRRNQSPQVIVPKRVWQGTRLIGAGKWALLGTTMAPGYHQEDFEFGSRVKLLKKYPHLRRKILRFTRAEQ